MSENHCAYESGIIPQSRRDDPQTLQVRRMYNILLHCFPNGSEKWLSDLGDSTAKDEDLRVECVCQIRKVMSENVTDFVERFQSQGISLMRRRPDIFSSDFPFGFVLLAQRRFLTGG